jgi:hypothetical protein
MRRKPVWLLSLKLVVVLALIGFSFDLMTTPSNAASECPNQEDYNECLEDGNDLTQWDEGTCQCYCNLASPLCVVPGNPAGEVNPNGCVCRGCIDLFDCGG